MKTTLLVYIGSSVLAYFIIPDKTLCLFYVLIFGPYGIIKFFIEQKRNTPIEIILKLVYFNVIIFISFLLYKQLFMPTMELQYPLIIMFIGGNVAFFIFDYVLTVFINSIRTKKFKI